MKWLSIYRANEKDGLGVCYHFLMNKAFLCKWRWRYLSEREALRKKVIKGKYRVEDGG